MAAVNPTAVLTLRGRLAWAHDWISDPSLAAVFQALPGANFIVNGAAPAKSSAFASAGAELRLTNGVTLLAKFDGEFASRARTYAGTGTMRWMWRRGAVELHRSGIKMATMSRRAQLDWLMSDADR